MFLSPIRATDPPNRKAWDNLCLYHDGTFYAFFNTIRRGETAGFALDVARSTDGVNWTFFVRDELPLAGAHAGYGLLRIGDRTFYYPTVTRPGGDIHFKIYVSSDYRTWEHLGDDADVRPDPRYYAARWEEVCTLEDHDPVAGGPVYYGYLAAEVREDVGEPSVGLVRSRDGIAWEVLPPPVIEWGELPSQHTEVCFCVKFDDRYYLGLGARLYLDSLGFSIFVFVSDSPTGPFVPDYPAFRLTGTSRRDVTYLGHEIDTPFGVLFALWQSTGQFEEIPSRNLSIGPLMRLSARDGHLRLTWWEGNEAAKGTPAPVNADALHWVHPTRDVRGEREHAEWSDGSISLTAGRDGAIVMFDRPFARATGFLLEGTLTVRESRRTIATHHLPAVAGFLLETRQPTHTEGPGGEPALIGSGYAILPETLGVTRAGSLRYANRRITDHDTYAEAAAWLVNDRSGPTNGVIELIQDDLVGPLGHATQCGVRHGRSHAFRLISRGEYVQLYLDDRYVQTYRLPTDFTGRIGFVCQDGSYALEQLRAWELNVRVNDE